MNTQEYSSFETSGPVSGMQERSVNEHEVVAALANRALVEHQETERPGDVDRASEGRIARLCEEIVGGYNEFAQWELDAYDITDRELDEARLRADVISAERSADAVATLRVRNEELYLLTVVPDLVALSRIVQDRLFDARNRLDDIRGKIRDGQDLPWSVMYGKEMDAVQAAIEEVRAEIAAERMRDQSESFMKSHGVCYA